MLLRTTRREVPIAPTRIGKYATFGLAVTVVFALAGDYAGYPRAVSGPYVAAWALLAAQCVALSFGQYFLLFVRTLHAPSR